MPQAAREGEERVFRLDKQQGCHCLSLPHPSPLSSLPPLQQQPVPLQATNPPSPQPPLPQQQGGAALIEGANALASDAYFFLFYMPDGTSSMCANTHACTHTHAHTHTHMCTIRCGAGRISACAISPDGRFVACVGGSQGRVRLYQLPAQQQHSSVANGNNLGGDGGEGGLWRD
eukprot:1124338-Pelagomonas_calceolata.AAC.7